MVVFLLQVDRAMKSQTSGESFGHRRREEDRYWAAESEAHTVNWNYIWNTLHSSDIH